MKKSLAERLRNAITGTVAEEEQDADDLEKARRPLPMEDKDDDGEPDDNPPSDEDQGQDAAPDKPAPPEDGDDEGGDDDGDDDEEDDDGKAPPAGGDDDEEDDDDLKRKVLQRSQENPDFFKSLAASAEGREAMKLIEASDAVAYMCQTFSDIVDGLVRQNSALQKSLDERLTTIETDNEVIAEALEKSLLLTADLTKSLGEQNDIIKSQGRRDSGKVGHGFGGVRVPDRIDPLAEKKKPERGETVVLTDEERREALKRKPKLWAAIAKSVQDEELNGDTGSTMMLKLGSAEGIVDVERYLGERHPDILKSISA